MTWGVNPYRGIWIIKTICNFRITHCYFATAFFLIQHVRYCWLLYEKWVRKSVWTYQCCVLKPRGWQQQLRSAKTNTTSSIHGMHTICLGTDFLPLSIQLRNIVIFQQAHMQAFLATQQCAVGTILPHSEEILDPHPLYGWGLCWELEYWPLN